MTPYNGRIDIFRLQDEPDSGRYLLRPADPTYQYLLAEAGKGACFGIG